MIDHLNILEETREKYSWVKPADKLFPLSSALIEENLTIHLQDYLNGTYSIQGTLNGLRGYELKTFSSQVNMRFVRDKTRLLRLVLDLDNSAGEVNTELAKLVKGNFSRIDDAARAGSTWTSIASMGLARIPKLQEKMVNHVVELIYGFESR